eukprot:TRINITY_DN7341_c0_g1_i2.p1 TRINITY_DN7341_c0_g1~~TRINITY_DN7341_c0_g1_i2.p1  ORF type:complete len:536 (-),score=122.01 TRINITY_DN7341_c0_g1_i2:94-1701(-)
MTTQISVLVLLFVIGTDNFCDAGSLAFVAGSEDAWAYAVTFGVFDQLSAPASIFSFSNATSALFCDQSLRAVVVDGSFRNLLGAITWLSSVQSTLSLWLASGGNLFFNVVPAGGHVGQTFDLPFGTTLQFSDLDFGFSGNCYPGKESDPIFRNVTCGWYGGRVSHGSLEHPRAEQLLVTEQGRASMIRLGVGYGTALMSTLTPPVFHYSLDSYLALRQSSLSYLLTRPQRTTTCLSSANTGDPGNSEVEHGDTASGSSATTMVGAIVGGLAGAVACALIIVGIIVVRRRRSRRVHAVLSSEDATTPPKLWTPGSSTRSLASPDSTSMLSPKSSDDSETMQAETEELALSRSRHRLAALVSNIDLSDPSLSPRLRGAVVIQRAYRLSYLTRAFRTARKQTAIEQAADAADAADAPSFPTMDADVIDRLPVLAPQPSFASFVKATRPTLKGRQLAPIRAQKLAPVRVPAAPKTAVVSPGLTPAAAASRIQRVWRAHHWKTSVRHDMLRLRDLVNATGERRSARSKRQFSAAVPKRVV